MASRNSSGTFRCDLGGFRRARETLDPAYFDPAFRQKIVSNIELLTKFLDQHPCGKDNDKWMERFPPSGSHGVLKTLGDFLAELAWWLHGDGHSLQEIRRALPKLMCTANDWDRFKLQFVRDGSSVRGLRDLMKASEKLREALAAIKNVHAGRTAVNASNFVFPQDMEKLISALDSNPEGLRMEAYLQLGARFFLPEAYFLQTPFDACTLKDDGAWYIGFRIPGRENMLAPQVLEPGTPEHQAFSNWHTFRTIAILPDANRSIFCFKSSDELKSSMYQLAVKARFPACSFCPTSVYKGAKAAAFARNVFRGMLPHQAIASLKYHAAISAPSEYDFSDMMGGLQEKLLQHDRDCRREGKVPKVEDLNLEFLHPKIAIALGCSRYEDMPAPKRTSYYRDGRVPFPNYYEHLDSIYESIREQYRTVRLRASSKVDKIAALYFDRVQTGREEDRPDASFLEAESIIMNHSTLVREEARSLVIEVMASCCYMTAENWNSCKVPTRVLERFKLQQETSAVTVPSLPRTYNADACTDLGALKMNIERRMERTQRPPSVMPMYHGKPVVDLGDPQCWNGEWHQRGTSSQASEQGRKDRRRKPDDERKRKGRKVRKGGRGHADKADVKQASDDESD